MRSAIISIVAIALLSCFNCKAKADAYRSICLTMTDQTTLLVNMDKNMTLGFVGNNLSITSGTYELTFPLDEVSSWSFIKGSEDSGVESVKPDDENIQIYDNKILFSDIPDGTKAVICDLNGRIFFADTISGNGEISLDTLPGGMFILNVNGKSIKIRVGR